MDGIGLVVGGFFFLTIVLLIITIPYLLFCAAIKQPVNEMFLGCLWLPVFGLIVLAVLGLLVNICIATVSFLWETISNYRFDQSHYPIYEVLLSGFAVVGVWYWRYRKRQTGASRSTES